MKDRRKLSETVLRYVRMLQLVPQGRRIDAGGIQSALEDEGMHISRRSVQRDLELLSTSFPGLQCDRRSKPFGWSWDREAPLLELPSMNLPTAITLELVRAYVTPALPRSTLRTLQRYFDRARDTMQQAAGSRMARWPRKVKVVPRGQPLVAPKVPDSVLDTVYGCLLEERRFKAEYRKRGSSQDKVYEVCPLGLVVRNGVLLLVCTLGEDQEIKHLVLHRMKSAERQERAAGAPPGFALDEHVDAGGAAFRYARSIQLKLLMGKEASITVREATLSTDQRVTEYDATRDLVEATVPDTLELRGWLASYGGLVEVVQPAALREHMARVARAMVQRYSSAAPRLRPALRKTSATPPRSMSATR